MSTKDRRVLVLQHSAPEHLGRIAESLGKEQVGYSYVRADLGQEVPAKLDGYEGLVVMGGPQAVYAEERFPFLRRERALVEHTLATNRPVLGVCLGSQILAQVLGSRVHPGASFEIGWRKVELTTDEEDLVLGHLPRLIVPFHWHGDVYDLPAESKPVGSSVLTAVQGFVWNRNTYGLMFHMEMTREQVCEMAEAYPDEVARGGSTPEALIGETSVHLKALRESSLEVFRRWAMLL